MIGPPAGKAIPRIGLRDRAIAVHHFRHGRFDALSRLLHDRYGPVVMHAWGSWKIVSLFGPEANRLVLLDPAGIFAAGPLWNAILGRPFRNGLLLRDGDDHRRHRAIMKGAFSRAALADQVERMNVIAAAAVTGWRQKPGTWLAFPALKQLTLDIAAQIFIGIRLGTEADRVRHAFEALVAASMPRLVEEVIAAYVPSARRWTSSIRPRGVNERAWLAAYLGELIPRRRADGGADLFSLLCAAVDENGERFTDEEIVDHVIFLMMAGHETTASAMASLMYELGRNPGWQARLRQECLDVGKAHIGMGDMDRLETLGWAIREALRLYPPLAVIPRLATAGFELHGYAIPRGAAVAISPIHTHTMGEWWDDPLRFDPARFGPARAEHLRHSHSWIPFGGGRHMCLGAQFAELQMKVVMYHLLGRCAWSVPDDYRMPMRQMPTLEPLDGLPVHLHGHGVA